jgi:hypothetical protein
MAGEDEGEIIMRTSHEEIWLLIISILLGILLAVAVFTIGWRMQHYIKIRFGNHIASQAVKNRMHHHGIGGRGEIGWAFVGWDGKEYFLRENSKCTL